MAKRRTINMVKSQVIYKDYSKDAERTALVSGENLAHMFGKIARWYTDISWVGHTHTEANITDFGTYAGASTKGGAATSANKLNIGSADIGSETKPVYFSYLTGKPVACTYSLNASVPANAVFTDINVKQSPSTANESREVLFAGNTGNTETTGTVGKSNKLYFNPSTGALTATSFSGSVAASNLTGTIDAGRLPTTAVTAGSYGPAAGGTLTYGGTFDVPYVTVDKYGRLTAGSTKTFTMPAQYTHPTYTSKTSGLYKITVDGTGHISGTAAVTAADLPAHTHNYISSSGITSTTEVQINPTGASYNEGLRIGKASNGWSNINFGCSNSITTGTQSGQWSVGVRGAAGATSGGIGDFTIEHNGASGTGLTLYADGSTPRWNNVEISMSGHTHPYLPESTVTGSPDLDTYLTSGVYHIKTRTSEHAPTTNHATLFVDGTVGTPYQLFIPDVSNGVWYSRYKSGSSAWSSWLSLKMTDTVYTHPTTSGNKHIPSGGSSGQYLKWSSDGTATWSAIAAADLPSHTHSYLPLSGGTMTGAITFQVVDAIKYNAASATYTMISFITGDTNGHGISIGGGGLTVLGSGESASALISALSLAASNETTYIASDNNIEFYSNCQTIGNRLGIVFDTSGRLRPNTNNTRTLGGTDFYWNKAYISQVVGRGTGGSWISARDNTVVKQPSMSTTSAYFPVISTKTKLGEWSIGTLGPDDESIYFAYTTDANYSAGTNNNKWCKINSDGAFSGSASKWTTARTLTIGSTGKSVDGSGNVSWSLSEIGAAAASHSHSYLPLAGGTMTGDITFTAVTSTSYPAKSKQIYFSGSTDWAKIYYQVDASDAGRLVFDIGDDTNTRIVFANSGTAKSYIDANGNFSGNAATATTATTATSAGKWTTARTLTLTGSVTGSASIDGSGNVSLATTTNHTHNYAGSSSAGGAATSANKLNTNAGGVINPVYFSGGVPVACKQAASGAYFSIVPFVRSDGVMEIGRYIDFHTTNASTSINYRINQWTADSIEFDSRGTNNRVNIYTPGEGWTQLSFQVNATDKAFTASGIRVRPLTASGTIMQIECSGNMVIGSGESPSTLYSNSYDNLDTTETERLYLASDSQIYFITNAQTYAGVKSLMIDNSGNLVIPQNQHVIQTQSSSGNYTSAIKWWKGGTDPGNYGPEIGQHNIGDTDGSICILPYNTSTSPWTGSVGLFISKTRLLYNGTAISLNGHTHTYLIDPGNSSYKIELAWSGASVPATDTTTYPAVFTKYNLTSGISVRVKESSWDAFKTFLGLGSAAYTNSSAYAAASHTHSYIPLSGSTDITGELVTTSANGYRLVYNKYGAIIRNDGTNWWFLITSQQSSDAAAKTASWADTSTLVNNSHPLRIQLSNGRVIINGYTIDKSVPSDAKFTDNNTTYSISTGDSNGQIKVTPSSGSAYNVSVKGLGSAAYTASSDYVPNTRAGMIAGINLLDIATATPVDDCYYITQDNAASNNNYYRRKHSALWAYVKGKADSTYAAKSHSHNYAGSTSAGGDAIAAQSLRVTHGNEINSSKPGDYTYIWFFYRWNDGGTEDTSGSKYISTIYFGNGNGAGTNTSVGRFADLQFNNIAAGTLRHTGGGASWWNDRNAAMLYQSYGDSNYRPTWGTATKDDGSWCCGNYNTNDLTFNYIPYSVYNAGQNPTLYKQIIFTEDAKIEARGYNVINNGSGRLIMDYSGIELTNSRTGTWAAGIDMKNASGTLLSAIGFHGTDTALTYTYLGGSYSDPIIKLESSGYATFKDGMKVNNNISLQETKNIILRPNHSSYTAGIGYDTSGNECIAIWAKNTVTRLRWYAGTDMSSLPSGTMMGITPDFEISKASGTAKGYIAGDSIVTYKILWSGSTSCTARSSTDITLTTSIAANKYRFIKIIWNVSGATGVSEIRADTLNVINNVSSASGATTANIIQFTISSDGKKLTVGPGTTTITVLQIAGVCVI